MLSRKAFHVRQIELLEAKIEPLNNDKLKMESYSTNEKREEVLNDIKQKITSIEEDIEDVKAKIKEHKEILADETIEITIENNNSPLSLYETIFDESEDWLCKYSTWQDNAKSSYQAYCSIYEYNNAHVDRKECEFGLIEKVKLPRRKDIDISS